MSGVRECVNSRAEDLTEEMNQNIIFVKKIAFIMKKKLPSDIELNDLVQSGMIGLLEAKKNYDEDYGVNFHQFALLRVKGAMIDFLRKNSWLSRDVNKSTKLISSTIEKLEKQGMFNPSSEQISKALGIDIESYHKLTETSTHRKIMDINDYAEWLGATENKAIEEELFVDQMKNKINHIIQHFDEREKIVLSLYYNDGLTFKQISQVLELTEARICQIHSQLIGKIQKKLRIEGSLKRETNFLV